jgi:diacylglycerol kinase
LSSTPVRSRSFPEAVRCAARGLRLAARRERHFRAQLVLAACALVFAAAAGLPRIDLAVLALTAAVVLGTELLNTATERLTDLVHPQHGPAAAAVKDVAAGAALLAAALSVAVAALVLLPRLVRLPAAASQFIAGVLALACVVLLAAGGLGRAGAGGA